MQEKLDQMTESSQLIAKMEEKLKTKRTKLLTEKLEKWDNKKLVAEFSQDLVAELLATDKEACLNLILPNDQIKIEDIKAYNTYLTTSLV